MFYRQKAAATFGCQTSVLSNIIIYPAEQPRPLLIEIQQQDHAIAFLLGQYGEELERFALAAGTNELPLSHYATGIYSIRVEAGQEVAVKQICL